MSNVTLRKSHKETIMNFKDIIQFHNNTKKKDFLKNLQKPQKKSRRETLKKGFLFKKKKQKQKKKNKVFK